MTTNGKSINFENGELTPPDNQTQKNQINFQINDKTAIIHLSNAVDIATLKFVAITKHINATYADDLESLTYPLKDVICLIWSTPMNELFEENLYFLFDTILDIAYCTYETLDEVWDGSTNIIESKLSEISKHILRIMDEVNILNVSEYSIEFDTNLAIINQTIVDLTISLVGFTSFITSIIHLIATEDGNIFVRVGSTASLLIIHQYALSAIACLLSRALKVINSLKIIDAAGIAVLETTIINYILNLQHIVVNNFTEATVNELFNGKLQNKLSKQLLISVNGMIGENMVYTIQSSCTSLLDIIQKHVPRAFHILPDLLEQLSVILFQCGHTEFQKLEQITIYAFDGLLDVVHHISYDLDKTIKSSASTGSFQEPSEPIDIALTDIRTSIKRLLRVAQHIVSDKVELLADLAVNTRHLIEPLLDPMNTIMFIRKHKNKINITLVASLQFVALYVIGLIVTQLLAMNGFQNFNTLNETYLNFSAILSLTLIKVQLIFDYTQSCMGTLKRLYRSLDDLYQELSEFDIETDVIGQTDYINLNRVRNLPWIRISNSFK